MSHTLQNNHRPRILIISTAYLPHIGGAELAVQEITDRLSGEYIFDLVCARLNPDLPRHEEMGAVRVRRVGIGRGLDKYLLPLYVTFKALRKRRYDLIWAVMASYGAFGVLADKKTPVLLTLQEGDSEQHILRRLGIFYRLWRKIFTRADHIQAISNHLADFARRHGARPPIDVVPNGIDVETYKNLDRNQESGIRSQEKTTIITTSRLVPKNGIDILIRAMALLNSSIPDTEYCLQIVGSGPDEQKLKNLAQKLGVADHIEFTGRVEPYEIPEYLENADIYARPSRSEGLGSAFLEAMAAGLPVVATPVGGIPDIVKHETTGLLAEPEDPQSVARQIERLIHNDELRADIAQNARYLVLEEYGWGKIAKRMNNIFKKLIK